MERLKKRIKTMLIDLSLPVSPLAQSPVIVAYHNRPIESAFDLVVTHNIRRLVLVDRERNYRGVVLQEDRSSTTHLQAYAAS